MNSGTTISHRLLAGEDVSGALAPMLAAASVFAARYALAEAAAQRLAIIVEELVTNVACHGGSGHDTCVSLEMRHADGAVVMALEDDCAPFDPRQAPRPAMPDPVRGGGVGLTLVRAWTDILSYDSANGRNRLVLRLRP